MSIPTTKTRIVFTPYGKKKKITYYELTPLQDLDMESAFQNCNYRNPGDTMRKR